MKITATLKQNVEVEVSDLELSWAIMHKVYQYLGFDMKSFDDAGCDWLTLGNKTYIGGADWLVSVDPTVAILVDTANLIRYGHIMKLEENEK